MRMIFSEKKILKHTLLFTFYFLFTNAVHTRSV